MFLFDLFTYLPFRIAPTTFGSPELVGGDFTSWCANLAASSGVPVGSVWLFWGVCLAGIVYVGQGLTFHLLATILVASGLYRSEEWPDLYDKPFTSTSLRELWSVRYSQVRHTPFLPARISLTRYSYCV
jgi:hypothetical protein